MAAFGQQILESIGDYVEGGFVSAWILILRFVKIRVGTRHLNLDGQVESTTQPILAIGVRILLAKEPAATQVLDPFLPSWSPFDPTFVHHPRAGSKVR